MGSLTWRVQELLEALSAASQAPSGEQAYKQIIQMVDSLNDPYTRIVPAKCATHQATQNSSSSSDARLAVLTVKG